jgi:thiamine phosphate synthase YjbQ (UPF0047 family)
MGPSEGSVAFRSSSSEVFVRAERRLGWVDLTDDLSRAIKDSGATNGCSVGFCTHTTCALLINDLEDGPLHDLEQRLEALIPVNLYYALDDLDRHTQNLQPRGARKRTCARGANVARGDLPDDR